MRYQKIDALRGLAVMGMVAFHMNYLLIHLFDTEILNFSPSFWYLLGKAVAIIFLLVGGISFFLSVRARGSYEIFIGSWKRAIVLALIAMSITLVTYIFIPKQRILFGIIHLFAVASFLLPFFVRYGSLNICIGACIIFLGILFEHVPVQNPYLFPLGFMQNGFYSADYYPIIPWFGHILVGYGLGAYIHDKNKLEKLFRGELWGGRYFGVIGKHSLLIYILHVPILYVFLLVLFAL